MQTDLPSFQIRMPRSMFLSRSHYNGYTQQLQRHKSYQATQRRQSDPCAILPVRPAGAAAANSPSRTTSPETESKPDLTRCPDVEPSECRTPPSLVGSDYDSDESSSTCTLGASPSCSSRGGKPLAGLYSEREESESLFGPSPPPSPKRLRTPEPALTEDAESFSIFGFLDDHLLFNETQPSSQESMLAGHPVNVFLGGLKRPLDSSLIGAFRALGVESDQDLDFLCHLDDKDSYAVFAIARESDERKVTLGEWLQIRGGLQTCAQKASAALSSWTLGRDATPHHAPRMTFSHQTDVWTFLYDLKKPLTQYYDTFYAAGIRTAQDLDGLCRWPMGWDTPLPTIKILDWLYIKDGLRERSRTLF